MKKIIPILILIAGCNSKEFRSIQSIDKGYRLDSVAAENRAKQISPCITVSQDTTVPIIITKNTTDTVTRTITDTVKLKCKDGSIVDTIITKKYYDINHRITKTNTRFITKTIEDKGKDIIIRDLNKQVAKVQQKKEFWMYCAIISTILLLLGIIISLIGKSLKNKRI